MADAGVDVLLASLGSDLPYLCGYTAMPSERLTMLVLPVEGEATLVLPELEAPRVAFETIAQVRAWGELEDPAGIVASLVGSAHTIAIGDQAWSVFLLRLQAALPAARFVSATPVTSQLRVRKEPEELARLRAAGAAVDRVAAQIPELRFAGSTELELGRQIAEMTVAEGHDRATFTIIASGPNGASPHHETGGRRVEPGDAVVIDFGGSLGGYQSDTTRMFHVGEPTPEFARAFAALRAAQQAGVEAVRPGVPAEAIDDVTRSVIADAGYGQYFIHRTGHGIGLDGHEDPYIIEGNDTILEPAMAFSVEPGIYLPGRYGMRIEDIVAVTGDGVENFNNSNHDLVIVD
jgi:Xaa-Pro aminopeptidase